MASIPQSYEYRQLFTLNHFNKSIDLIVEQMWKHLDARTQGQRHSSVFPTIIGIEIDFAGQQINDIVRPLRVFMNQLRKVHQKHFVRFAVDTLWAMESDCGDIFYGTDADKSKTCDAVWNVRIVNPIRNQFEVTLKLPSNFERFDLLADLSRGMRQFIQKGLAPLDDGQVEHLVGEFVTKTHRLYQAQYLHEPLHILLLPSRSGGGFYPIALYGMSYSDGIRRQNKVISQNVSQHFKYPEIFTRPTTPEDLVYDVLCSIQDHDNFGITKRNIKEIYGLSELIFAYWASHKTKGDTNHDVILFNVTDPLSHSFEAIRFPIASFNS